MNLNDLLDQSAAANSGALAFVSQNSSITYGELRRAVERAAVVVPVFAEQCLELGRRRLERKRHPSSVRASME